MKLCFFILMVSALFANEMPENLSDMIEFSSQRHCSYVNPQTGQLHLQAIDLKVAGAQPIEVSRIYAHMTNQSFNYGNWLFHPEAFMVANFSYSKRDQGVVLGQQMGLIWLNQMQQGSVKFDPTKTKSTQIGSGQNHPSNIQVNYSKQNFDPKNRNRFMWMGTVTQGDGCEKSFWTPMHSWEKPVKSSKSIFKDFPPFFYTPYVCFISQERLPNGNYVFYHYRHLGSHEYYPSQSILTSIETKNSTQTTTLAKVDFEYQKMATKDLQPVSFKVKTSDQREVSYQAPCLIDEKHTQHAVLDPNRILYSTYNVKSFLTHVSSDQTTSTYSYHQVGRFSKPFLTQIHNDHEDLIIEYDRETGKVLRQKAPLHADGSYAPLYSFEYEEEKTKVIDAIGNATLYFYEDEALVKVQSFEQEKLFSTQTYTYNDEGDLVTQALFDADETLIKQESFTYDDRHNCISYTVEGNICSEGSWDHNTLYFEYSEDGFNLLLSQKDLFGKKVVYEYQPQTNLLVSQKTYLQDQLIARAFYTYDDAACLVESWEDNGCSEDKSNLQNVQYCLVKKHTINETLPCYGLPLKTQVYTLDEHKDLQPLYTESYTYTSFGKIAKKQVFDTLGDLVSTLFYYYDTHENLIEMIDETHETSTYCYTSKNKLFSHHHPCFSKHYVYDAHQRVIKIEESSAGLDFTTELSYDLLSRVTQKKDPCGQITSYTYDLQNHLVSTTDFFGTESCCYNVLGHLTEKTNRNHETVQTFPNLLGQPLKIIHSNQDVELFTYDVKGNLLTHTDVLGVITSYEYDLQDRVVKTTLSYNGKLLKQSFKVYDHYLIKETNWEGTESCYVYNYLGQKIQETTLDRTTYYKYDCFGNLIEQKDLYTTCYEYDAKNRLISKKVFDQQGAICSCFEFTYDALDRQVTKKIDDSVFETYTNHLGWLVYEKTPMGIETFYEYQLTDHVVQKTLFSHGAYDLKTLNMGGVLFEHQKYDLNHHLLFWESFKYDGEKHLIEALGHTLTWPDQIKTTRWEYENDCLVSLIQESYIEKYKYTHSLLTQVIYPSHTLEKRYDPLGREVEILGDDIHFTYKHDLCDRIIEAKDLKLNQTTKLDYDRFGNLIQEELGNGLLMRYSYDALNRKTLTVFPDKRKAHYSYKGPFLDKVNWLGVEYCFEEKNSLGQAILTKLPCRLGYLKNEYDQEFHLCKSHSDFHALEASYDTRGNLLKTSFNSKKNSYTSEYSYDDLNQLTQDPYHSYRYDALGSCTLFDDQTITSTDLGGVAEKTRYDTQGRTVFDGKNTHHYDCLDRLIRSEGACGKISYTYDPFGRRLTKKIHHFLGSTKEEFFWEGEIEVGSFIDYDLAFRRICDPSFQEKTLFIETHYEYGHYLFFPIYDVSNNLVLLIDLDDNEVLGDFKYDAYGLLTRSNIPWTYHNKRLDAETGLFYFGKRYYAPFLRTWITQDPAKHQDSYHNPYLFLCNNPLSFQDYLGLSPEYDTISVPWRFRPYEDLDHLSEYKRGVNQDFRSFERTSLFFKNYFSDFYKLGSNKLENTAITFVNGMLNSKDEAAESAEYLSNLAGNAMIYSVYNGSQGIFNDTNEAVTGWARHKATVPVGMMQGLWDLLLEENKSNPNFSILHIAHSEGAIITRTALEGLPERVRNKINVVAIAPGAYIDKNLCKSSVHFRSGLDVVPYLCLGVVGKLGKSQGVYVLKRHPEAKGTDHAFKSPTYREKLQQEINRYKD